MAVLTLSSDYSVQTAGLPVNTGSKCKYTFMSSYSHVRGDMWKALKGAEQAGHGVLGREAPETTNRWLRGQSFGICSYVSSHSRKQNKLLQFK